MKVSVSDTGPTPLQLMESVAGTHGAGKGMESRFFLFIGNNLEVLCVR